MSLDSVVECLPAARGGTCAGAPGVCVPLREGARCTAGVRELSKFHSHPALPAACLQFQDVQGAHALLNADRPEFQSLYYYRPYMYALRACPAAPAPFRFFSEPARSHPRRLATPRRAGCMNVDWVWNRDTQNVGYINYTRVMWSDHSYSYDDSAYQVCAHGCNTLARTQATMGRNKPVWGFQGSSWQSARILTVPCIYVGLCAQTGPPCARKAKRGRRRIR